VGGAQPLGEEADAQLLDHPADLVGLLVGLGTQAAQQAHVGLAHLGDAGQAILIAAGIVGQLVQPHPDAAQIAHHVVEAPAPGRGDEPGVDQAVEMGPRVVAGGLELGVGDRVQALGDLASGLQHALDRCQDVDDGLGQPVLDRVG